MATRDAIVASPHNHSFCNDSQKSLNANKQHELELNIMFAKVLPSDALKCLQNKITGW